MKIKALDVAAVALAVAAVLFSASIAYTGTSGSVIVKIDSEGGVYHYPVDSDRAVSVPGPLGETLVVIAGGEARVESSPCKNKTCVHSGPIGAVGSWVGCLPNRVFVSIEGSKDRDDVDTLSY